MPLSLLPPYSQACIASAGDNSTVYLVGTPVSGGVSAHAISLANISAPIVTDTFFSSKYSIWVHDAPKACSSYLGRSLSEPDTVVHIQQFGPGTTWGANFYSNGTFRQPGAFNVTSFVSKQTFAYIGQAGDNAWALTRTNDTLRPWSAIQLNAGNSSFYNNRNVSLPVVDPLLFVGTYSVSSSLPGNGYIVIFDTMSTGMIYRTICYDFFAVVNDKIVFLDQKPVDMNGVKLTANAFHTNIKSAAFILDKAQDDTVSIYYIDPLVSTTLHRIPISSKVPRFTVAMTATSVGSHIVLYSTTTDGSTLFHLLNTETNEWSGPDLVVPAQDPEPSTQKTGDQNYTNSNLGAIIGGVVGGISVLAVGVLLFMRSRRRRSGYKENINEGNNNIDDDKDEPPTKETTRSPQGQSKARRHPQFPAGVGLANGYTYEEEPSVTTTAPGPQFIPPDHQQYSIVVSPLQLHSHKGAVLPKVVHSPQDWSHFPHTYGNKSEDSSSEGTTVASPALHAPPLSPPIIPARPSGHASYSLVQLQDGTPSY